MRTQSKLIPYWMFFVVIGGMAYFLYNSLCVFHGHRPVKKMHDEALVIMEKIEEVLIVHGYCESKYDCTHNKQAAFFDVDCGTRIMFEIYNPAGVVIDQATISEILATISQHSTYTTHTYFYNERFKPKICCRSTATTEAFIYRSTP